MRFPIISGDLHPRPKDQTGSVLQPSLLPAAYPDLRTSMNQNGFQPLSIGKSRNCRQLLLQQQLLVSVAVRCVRALPVDASSCYHHQFLFCYDLDAACGCTHFSTMLRAPALVKSRT
jgi:hypothetical protein